MRYASGMTLELDRQLCFALYKAEHAVTRSYQEHLVPLGLTYPQYITLLALWGRDEPVPMKELSEELCLDSGTLTPLLRRLEKQGLIDRAVDPADERRRVIALTDAGRALKARAEGIPAAQLEAFAATGVDLAQLKSALEAFARLPRQQ